MTDGERYIKRCEEIADGVIEVQHRAECLALDARSVFDGELAEGIHECVADAEWKLDEAATALFKARNAYEESTAKEDETP